MRYCFYCNEVLGQKEKCSCSHKENNINFEITFTGIKCDKCGSKMAYCKKCSTCGKVFDEINTDIDPTYEKRALIFQNLLDISDDFKLSKSIHKDINYYLSENEYSYILYIEEVRKVTKALSSLSERHPLENVKVIDVEKNEEYCKNVKLDIEKYEKEIIKIYDDFNCVPIPRLFFNLHIRTNEIIENLFLSIQYFVKCLLAKNLEELQKYHSKPQVFLDSAVHSMIYFQQIIDFSSDLKNKMSMSKALSIMSDTIKISNKSSIDDVISDTIKYFTGDIEAEYNDQNIYLLMDLAHIKSISMNRFIEKRFHIKTRKLLKILNNAHKKNSFKFKEVFEKYEESYKNAIKKYKYICDLDNFNINNKIKDDLYIVSIIQGYKTVVEGIFTNLANIFIYALKVSRGKEVNIDAIDKMKFMDKLNQLQVDEFSKNKDLIKLIRNSVAHDSFDIDSINKKVKFIDKERENNLNKERELEYIELMDNYLEVMENIFAIKTAIDIFLINNQKEYLKVFNKISEINFQLNKEIKMSGRSESLEEIINFKIHKNELGIKKKIGRNDLCLCGSGKKYKKCCL